MMIAPPDNASSAAIMVIQNAIRRREYVKREEVRTSTSRCSDAVAATRRTLAGKKPGTVAAVITQSPDTSSRFLMPPDAPPPAHRAIRPFASARGSHVCCPLFARRRPPGVAAAPASRDAFA